MIGIGTLIKAIRNEKKFSVTDLCEGICTERFMYMIENNNRIPSAEIIKKIGERLEINIYDYMEFTGYRQPLKSKAYIEESRKLKNNREYELLEEITNQMQSTEDNFRVPLRYEIMGNLIYSSLFYKKDLQSSYMLIDEALYEISQYNAEEIVNMHYFVNDFYFINFMNFLFINYRLKGEDQKAQIVIDDLWHNMNRNARDKNYESIYISIAINYLYDYIFIYKNNHFKNDIEALLAYQFKNGHLNRIFFTYYLLSGHYYNIDDIEKSREYFKLMVAAGLSVSNKVQFQELIDDVDKTFVKKLFPNGVIEINLNKKD